MQKKETKLVREEQAEEELQWRQELVVVVAGTIQQRPALPQRDS